MTGDENSDTFDDLSIAESAMGQLRYVSAEQIAGGSGE